MIGPVATSTMPSLEPIEHTDLTEKVHQLLRDKIFARELKPGARLDLDHLADGLRISRAPINNAIIRLAADGLVRTEPRRGTFVRELTTRDVAEVYEVRRALEIRAAELGVEAATDHEVARLDSILDQMGNLSGRAGREYLAYVKLDLEFHLALVGLSGNDKITQTYRDLHIDVMNARLYCHGMPRAWRVVCAEHRAILAGYGARDITAVKAAVIQLIENGQRASVQRIEELGGVI